MNLPRSTYYDVPVAAPDDPVTAEIQAICGSCRNYGYRRVTAELRNRDFVVNSKKVRRIMRAHALSPRKKRRHIATTDSDHDNPIYPNLAKGVKIDGPDQLWVGDITFVAIATGFVYLAVILDAWSRKVVGYALGRNIDTRLTLAALNAAIAARKPLPGCVFHTDRGCQYAAARHRHVLEQHGFIGSMSRKGNPYDNAKAESFMKTMKVEAVYVAEYDTFEDVAADLPAFIENVYNQTRLHSALGYMSPNKFEEKYALIRSI